MRLLNSGRVSVSNKEKVEVKREVRKGKSYPLVKLKRYTVLWFGFRIENRMERVSFLRHETLRV